VGRLEGKVAVITGAGRGIGRATAVKFAAEGARLVLNDIDGEPLGIVADETGGMIFVGDTSNPDEAAALVERAVETFERIDILVNNAGTTRDKMFHAMPSEDWDLVMRANLETAVNSTRAVVPHMRAAAKAEIAASGVPAYHRKITFTTSIAALRPDAGQSNYVAAKSAILGFSKAMARELGRLQINVNAVAPGFIDTRLTAERADGEREPLGLTADVRDDVLKQTALGYFGSPEDVANAHVFLASSEADYLSGAVLPVSGGLLGA
jgi:3-oxoacyl-[acyl-carrier protein] reductase